MLKTGQKYCTNLSGVKARNKALSPRNGVIPREKPLTLLYIESQLCDFSSTNRWEVAETTRKLLVEEGVAVGRGRIARTAALDLDAVNGGHTNMMISSHQKW